VFPNRSKLLSSAEDSTVAVTRTRDWNLLHTFKCPIPKQFGRPSGDTAALGGAPSGVNDFAVHPSNKIMISVGKGERCMRLWNLETGKKSRVLNFDKGTLIEIGEGRHSTGEARRIVWGSAKGGEDEFAVGFERDVLVFGMDCRPRCRVMREAGGKGKTKIHEFAYVELGGTEGESVLAVATEDGRLCFFDTTVMEPEPEKPKAAEEEDEEKAAAGGGKKKADEATVPCAKMVAQLGGKEAGFTGRIKDFKILPVEDEQGERSWYAVTGGSDGNLRVWRLEAADLRPNKDGSGKQVGKLVGSYATENRVTCVEAFIMIPRPEGAEESEYEFEDESSEDEEESDAE